MKSLGAVRAAGLKKTIPGFPAHVYVPGQVGAKVSHDFSFNSPQPGYQQVCPIA